VDQRSSAFAAIGAAAIACACLAVLGAVPFPLPWYEPLLGTFRFAEHHSSVAMDWYSRCLVSFALGGVAFFPIRAWSRHRDLAPATFRLALGWAVLAFLLVAGFYGWTLNGRRALPEPLPAGYQAR
jgi:hypothetical protein